MTRICRNCRKESPGESWLCSERCRLAYNLPEPRHTKSAFAERLARFKKENIDLQALEEEKTDEWFSALMNRVEEPARG